MNILRPSSNEEAAEIICTHSNLIITGSGRKRDFLRTSIRELPTLTSAGLCGIVEYSPADMVVVVRAGTLLADLNAELALSRQTLPIPPSSAGIDDATAGFPGTVGGIVAANLPTRWDGLTKGVRYFVLGMTVILADGSIVKCGSKAVKNVAGYDVHKLFIGSWGHLGLIAKVALRVFPLLDYESKTQMQKGGGDRQTTSRISILRAPITEATRLADTIQFPFALDELTGTIWAQSELPLPPPQNGWARHAGYPTNTNLAQDNLDLATRIKHNFDSTNRFVSLAPEFS